ncbi:MAG: hypothetical protein IT340_19860 [Chloroflexi bacterium]|nr:hypothetical protein [Chloroflexota bacterium]
MFDSLDGALHYHLTYNHYPPVPSAMVGTAKRAIANANAGQWQRKVELGRNVSHVVYGNLVPTRVLVQALRLDAFIDAQED